MQLHGVYWKWDPCSKCNIFFNFIQLFWFFTQTFYSQFATKSQNLKDFYQRSPRICLFKALRGQSASRQAVKTQDDVHIFDYCVNSLRLDWTLDRAYDVIDSAVTSSTRLWILYLSTRQRSCPLRIWHSWDVATQYTCVHPADVVAAE